MKNRKHIGRAMAIALFLLIIISTPILSVQAALMSWGNMLNETGFYNNRTYSLRDITSYYGIQTTDGGPMTGSESGRFFDNMRHASDGSRLMYGKKLYVKGHVGDTIALVAAKEDTADVGGSSLVGNNMFYWCAMEWDSNGYALYDPGWSSLSTTHVLGKTTNSGKDILAYGVDSVKRQNDLGYITLYFRWYNGDDSLGSGTLPITPLQIKNQYPIFCIATEPFNYTFNLNGGNISGSTGNVSVERFGISDTVVPTQPTRTGYTFAGWKITSQSGKQKNKVYTTEQLKTMFTDTKYYSSLFEDATFEAQWTQKRFELVKSANSWHGGTFVKRTPGDEEWYNTVGRWNINDPIPDEYVIQEWVINSDGVIERIK